jgi:hypothetical protein
MPHALDKGCTNPGHQFAQVSELCVVVVSICMSPVQNMLSFTILVPGLWGSSQVFGKFVALALDMMNVEAKNVVPFPYIL